MNFKQWFHKRYGDGLVAKESCKYLTKKGWSGAKKEVLKILNRYKTSIYYNSKECSEEISPKIFEEIKKL